MSFKPPTAGAGAPKFGFTAGAAGGAKTPSFGIAKPVAAAAAPGAAPAAAAAPGVGTVPKFGAPAAAGAATTPKFGVAAGGATAPKFGIAGAVKPTAAAPTATTATAAPTATAPTTAAATTTTTAPKFGLGAKPATSVTIAPAAGAATSPAAGATTATAAATTTAAPAAAGTTVAPGTSKFQIGAKPVGTATTAAAGTTAAVGGAAKAPPAWKPNVDIPSLLKGKTLEEMINEWSAQIDSDIFQFTQMAMLVGEWDKKVSSNSKKILDLKQKVDMVETAQSELNKNLELITAQQTQLSTVLTALETSVEKWSLTVDLGPQDAERERGYALADDIDVQLNQMSNKLKEMIDRLNANQERENAKDGEHPAFQILHILDSHLNSLAWIDNTSTELATKLLDLQSQFSRRPSGAANSDSSWASRYY